MALSMVARTEGAHQRFDWSEIISLAHEIGTEEGISLDRAMRAALGQIDDVAEYAQTWNAMQQERSAATKSPSAGSSDALALTNVTNWADDLIGGIVWTLPQELPDPAANVLFQAGMDLYESAEDSQKRLAHIMVLDALAASPESVMAAFRLLRTRIAEADPSLALLR